MTIKMDGIDIKASNCDYQGYLPEEKWMHGNEISAEAKMLFIEKIMSAFQTKSKVHK